MTPTPPQRVSPSGRKYTVATPKSYKVLDPFAPEPPFDVKLEGERFFVRTEKPSKAEVREVRARGQAPEKRAIWIVHGMGQQVQFETLDALAEGVMRARHLANGGEWAPKFRAVKVGDQTLQRVELDVIGEKTKKKYELHLYEAYWAPKTEGVANIADVVSFLWDGGARGLLNSRKAFKRALMGEVYKFHGGFRTPFYITLTMIVLVALTLLNAVIVAATAAKVATLGLGANLPSLTAHFPQISAVASLISAVAITFGSVLFLAQLSKPSELPSYYRRVLEFFSWVGFAIAALAITAGGALIGGVVLPTGSTVPGALAWKGWFVHCLGVLGDGRLPQEVATFVIVSAIGLVAVALTFRGIFRSDKVNPAGRYGMWVLLFAILSVVFGLNISAIVYPILLVLHIDLSWLITTWMPPRMGYWFQNPFWVWPFLIFLSAQIRTLLVEYVGDVAIYVASNKIDRFDDVRAQIKDIALKSASAVYLAKQEDSDEFEYENIAIVGHSLGSVIAYDALNHLMNDDVLSGNKIRAVERTQLFETFGSPLDKTTFFFTIQGKDKFEIREQLATVVQPLIQDEYKFRKFPWINVYSHNDIISGHLDFFDYPRDADLDPHQRLLRAQWHVMNYLDKDAAIALVAHVDYWKNATAWRLLYDHIAP